MHLHPTFRLRATRSFLSGWISALIIILSLSAVHAQPSPGSAGDFFKSITGDWVGICEQSTDGEQAENKYFHANIKQAGTDTFNSEFRYYLTDASGKPVQIGSASMTTTIQPDGTAINKINGTGTMLVQKKPTQQKHDLTEVLVCNDTSSMSGKITGKIDVSGMPFGLGKNVKVANSTSKWALNNGTLEFQQTIKAGIKVFVFSKTFTVVANSTATRGTDVVSLMKAEARIASKPHATP